MPFPQILMYSNFHGTRQRSLSSLILLLLFSSLSSLSLAYNLPGKYFISCGSNANVTYGGRTFVGDDNQLGFSWEDPSSRSSSEKADNISSVPTPLYQTARVFPSPFTYQFNIDNPGNHLVRLHFFAFSSTSNLSSAIFNVSTSRFLLLHEFSPKSQSTAPVVMEFFLNIDSSNFQLYIAPREASFAFVNAIEVFQVPTNFTVDEAAFISSAGIQGIKYKGILSLLLQTIYRINVGGLAPITENNDTLWRKWEFDDPYLINSNNSQNLWGTSPDYQVQDDGPVLIEPNFVSGNSSKYIAPILVYQSAKVMKVSSNNSSNLSNITWNFAVRKNSNYRIRFHFCNIIPQITNDFHFTLSINSDFQFDIHPFDIVSAYVSPFYMDFVVGSVDSEALNISIGPTTDPNYSTKNAFLNGLEIMEIISTAGSIPPMPNGKNSSHLGIVLGTSLGGFGLICILLLLFFMGVKFLKSKPVEVSVWSPLPIHGGGSSHSRTTQGTISGSPIPNLHLGLTMSFSEILFATNNFDGNRIVGKGGFGYVYSGILRDGRKVAVKRSNPGSGQGLPEFQAEILVLSKIRHRNLVSLIGYCDEKSEMILAYEFMEKGTLRDHLYGTNLPSLSWKQRLHICIGSARGLQYLHEGSAGGIIHRDVKSTNILLDENNVAKVADFGLSRTGPLDQTYVSTNVKGTFGYLDPEYFKTEQLTDKSDVYSFGVVLFEVLCARPALDPTLPREEVNLAEWAVHCTKKGLLEEIIDPCLKDQIDPNSLRKFSETSERCLQEDSSERPTMSDVLWDLEYALQLQQSAKQREPHEDSIIDASDSIQMPNVRRLPSLSSFTEVDQTAISGVYENDSTENSVFSQLRAEDAR